MYPEFRQNFPALINCVKLFLLRNTLYLIISWSCQWPLGLRIFPLHWILCFIFGIKPNFSVKSRLWSFWIKKLPLNSHSPNKKKEAKTEQKTITTEWDTEKEKEPTSLIVCKDQLKIIIIPKPYIQYKVY